MALSRCRWAAFAWFIFGTFHQIGPIDEEIEEGVIPGGQEDTQPRIPAASPKQDHLMMKESWAKIPATSYKP